MARTNKKSVIKHGLKKKKKDKKKKKKSKNSSSSNSSSADDSSSRPGNPAAGAGSPSSLAKMGLGGGC